MQKKNTPATRTTANSGKFSKRLSKSDESDHGDFRGSELFFKQLIESLRDYCVFSTDLQGNISSWNSGAQMLTGWTEEQIIGKNAGVLYTLADRRNKRHLQELEIARKKGKAVNERWHLKKDGSKFWGSGLVFPLFDEKKKLRGFTKAMRDLTKERNSELALKESETFAQSIFHSSPDCVKVLDLQANLLTMNEHGLKNMEIDDFSAFEGKCWLQFWEGAHQKAITSAIARARKGKMVRFQGQAPTARGTNKWWDVLISPIRGADGKIKQLLAVSRDISKQKEAEEEKQQMIVELRTEKLKLEQNEARLYQLQRQKDDFISMASHELKTPITSIKAYGQVLESIFRKNEQTKEAGMLLKLNAQIDRLTNLIGDLLDVTKIQSGRLQFKEDYFPFNDLLNEVVEEMQLTSLKHTISIKATKGRNVYGDRERVAQVLSNLLSNAIKYSPNSDKVILSTAYDKNEIIVSVKDFGVGIASSNQDKIFEQFYRVTGDQQNTFPGLGLGLYISAEIIHRSGGRIWLSSSTPGKGSTFCFSLPLKAKAAGQ